MKHYRDMILSAAHDVLAQTKSISKPQHIIIAVMNRNLYSPTGGLRARVTYYQDNTVTFDAYSVDDRQRVIWEVPISKQAVQELDWSINMFGSQRVGDSDSWAYNHSHKVDYQEDSSEWIARYITPLIVGQKGNLL